MPTRTFIIDGKAWDVPAENAEKLLKEFPNAKEMRKYSIDGKPWNIPVDKEQDFLKEFPNAEPLHAEKKKEGIDLSFGLRDILPRSSRPEGETPSPSPSPSVPSLERGLKEVERRKEEHRSRIKELDALLFTPSTMGMSKPSDPKLVREREELRGQLRSLRKEESVLQSQLKAMSREEQEQRMREREARIQSREVTQEDVARRDEASAYRNRIKEINALLFTPATMGMSKPSDPKLVKEREEVKGKLRTLEMQQRQELKAVQEDYETLAGEVGSALSEFQSKFVFPETKALETEVLSHEGRVQTMKELSEKFNRAVSEQVPTEGELSFGEKLKRLSDIEAELAYRIKSVGRDFTTVSTQVNKSIAETMLTIVGDLGTYLQLLPSPRGRTVLVGHLMEEWAKGKSEPFREYTEAYQRYAQEELGEFSMNDLGKKEWWIANGGGLAGSTVAFGGLAMVTGPLAGMAATGMGLTGVGATVGAGLMAATVNVPIMSMVYGGSAYKEMEEALRAQGETDEGRIREVAADAAHRTFLTILPTTIAFNAVTMGLAFASKPLMGSIPNPALRGAADAAGKGVAVASSGFDNQLQEGIKRYYHEQAMGLETTPWISMRPESVQDWVTGAIMGGGMVAGGSVTGMVRTANGDVNAQAYKGWLRSAMLAEFGLGKDMALAETAVEGRVRSGGMTRTEGQEFLKAVDELINDAQFQRMSGEAAVLYVEAKRQEMDAKGVLEANADNKEAKRRVEEARRVQELLALENDASIVVVLSGTEHRAYDASGNRVMESEMTESQKKWFDHVRGSDPHAEAMARPVAARYQIEVDGEMMDVSREEMERHVMEQEGAVKFNIINDDAAFDALVNRLKSERGFEVAETTKGEKADQEGGKAKVKGDLKEGVTPEVQVETLPEGEAAGQEAPVQGVETGGAKGATYQPPLLSRAKEAGVIEHFDVPPDGIGQARKALVDFVKANWVGMDLTPSQQSLAIQEALQASTQEEAALVISSISKQSLMRKERSRMKEEAKAGGKAVWDRYREENRGRIAKLPPSVREMVKRRGEKMTADNADRTIDFLTRALNNQEYVKKIDKLTQKQKEYRKQKRKGDIKEYLNGITDVRVKGKHIFSRNEVVTLLNNLDVSHLSPDLVIAMDEAFDGLLAKKQDFVPVLNLLYEYSEQVALAQEKQELSELNAKSVERVMSNLEDRLERIQGRVAKLRRDASLGTIIGLEKELKALERTLGRTEPEVMERLEQLDQDMQGELSKLPERLREEIDARMDEAKINELRKFSLDATLTRETGEWAGRALSTANRMLPHTKLPKQSQEEHTFREAARRAMRSKVPTTLLENISHDLNQINETGIVPKDFHRRVNDLEGYVKAGAAIETIFEPLRLLDAGRTRFQRWMSKDKTEAVAGDGRKLIRLYGNWMDAYFRIESNFDKPIARQFVAPYDAAVERAKSDGDMDTRAFNEALWDMLGGTRMVTTKISPSDRLKIYRVGIIAENLKHYHLKDMEVTKRDGLYFISNEDYLAYRKGEGRAFRTETEAKEFYRNNKELYHDDIDSKGYQLRKGFDSTARLTRNTQHNRLFLDIERKAYQSLKKGDAPLIVRSMEDAAKILTDKKELRLLEEMNWLFDRYQGKQEVNAAMDNRDYKRLPHYYPTYYQSGDHMVLLDGNTVSDNILSRLKDPEKLGKPPLRMTGRVKDKAAGVFGWTNSDVTQVVDHYVNETNLSYHLLPLLKQEVKAMNEVRKHYAALKEGVSEGVPYSRMEQFSTNFMKDRLRRYADEMKRGRIFGSKQLGFTYLGKDVDVTKTVENYYSSIRAIALADVMRPILDGVPQMFRQGMIFDPAQWNVARYQELQTIIPYLPEGSLFRSMEAEKMARFDAQMWDSARQPKLKSAYNAFMGMADYVTKSAAWMKKFDTTFEGLTGEKLDTKRFSTDGIYRETVQEYVEDASAVAESYSSSIHFSRSTGSSRGSFMFGAIRQGTTAYTLLSPLMSYTMQQTQAAEIAVTNLMGGSGLPEAKEAGRLAGVVASNTVYSTLAGSVLILRKLMTAIATGREDREEEMREQLQGVWSAEGIAMNALGGITTLMLAGYGSSGAQMMNLLVAGGETFGKGVDPIGYAEAKGTLEKLRRVTGTGFWNVGDLEAGRVNLKVMMNFMLPLIGGSMYDLGEAGIGTYQVVDRLLGGKEDVPLKEDEALALTAKLMGQILLIRLGGPPLSKDVAKTLDEIVAQARRQPYSLRIEEGKDMVSLLGTVRNEVDRLAGSESLKRDREGNLKFRIGDDERIYREKDGEWQQRMFWGWRTLDENAPVERTIASYAEGMELLKGSTTVKYNKRDGEGFKEAEKETTYWKLMQWHKENHEEWRTVMGLYEAVRSDRGRSMEEKVKYFKQMEPMVNDYIEAVVEGSFYIAPEAEILRIKEELKDLHELVDRIMTGMEWDIGGLMQQYGE